jgi:hypothetical protein
MAAVFYLGAISCCPLYLLRRCAMQKDAASIRARLHQKSTTMSKEKGVYTGKIEKDEFGNFFAGEYLLDYKQVVTNKFKVGDVINIKTVIANPSDASAGWYPMKSNNFFLANLKPNREE